MVTHTCKTRQISLTNQKKKNKNSNGNLMSTLVNKNVHFKLTKDDLICRLLFLLKAKYFLQLTSLHNLVHHLL